MPFFDQTGREIRVKLLAVGPAFAGKSTNLQHLHESVRAHVGTPWGELAMGEAKPVGFDYAPPGVEVNGYPVRFQVLTLPGQATEDDLFDIIDGVDGGVFVADSNPARADANIESMEWLLNGLEQLQSGLRTVPFVMQYNKRDLPGAASVNTLRAFLNQERLREQEAVATEGRGVLETWLAVTTAVVAGLQRSAGRR